MLLPRGKMTPILLPKKETMHLLTLRTRTYNRWRYNNKLFLNSLTPKQKSQYKKAEELFEEYKAIDKELNEFIASEWEKQ